MSSIESAVGRVNVNLHSKSIIRYVRSVEKRWKELAIVYLDPIQISLHPIQIS
ncbi:MAG: hypothetical protein L6M37_01580 [Candidatus Methylarchaceae archaeon HK02M1]|nr:hypothetical protein [Candidatus Methylarchaceae archaeon HK01M]MCP8311628.1 hypothetical protein [Candidatus Methylarchaceae archaeon HK02M1]